MRGRHSRRTQSRTTGVTWPTAHRGHPNRRGWFSRLRPRRTRAHHEYHGRHERDRAGTAPRCRRSGAAHRPGALGGLHCWQYLARHHGVKLDIVPIPRGEFRAAELLAAVEKGIRSDTRVISVSHVLSSTGLRMPIAELASLAKSRGILCVVDGAQAVGAIRVNVREFGRDAYATSGHKRRTGPKGTGLLFIAKDAQPLSARWRWKRAIARPATAPA